MRDQDAVSLTRTLLQFDTVNPPGRERDCARHAGALLQEWGFAVQFFEYEENRTSLVARLGGSDKKAPLCLTGHLDVVPQAMSPAALNALLREDFQRMARVVRAAGARID